MAAFRGVKVDPIRNFKFQVNFPSALRAGSSRAGYSAVRGLSETTEVVDYREGTDPGHTRKLFGQTTYDNVTLEQGITLDAELVLWRQLIKKSTSGGKLTAEGLGTASASPTRIRRDVLITLGDYHAETSRSPWRWELQDAWPTKHDTGEMTGDGNDVLLWTTELAHEGIEYYIAQ